MDISTWGNFPQFEGLGGGFLNDNTIQDFAKALQAGADLTNPGAVRGLGRALLPESLDDTLRATTFEMKEIELWRDIPKEKATNNVVQDNVIREYGEDALPPWVSEGGFPNESSPIYERQVDLVKYMATTRRVTIPITMMDFAHNTDATAQEVLNGTMYLIRQLEIALFFGDSSLQSLQFDGYERRIRTQSPAANIVDMRGAPLNEQTLVNGAMVVRDAPNFGSITDLFLDPQVHGDISRGFFPKGRYDLDDKSAREITLGLVAKGYSSPAGYVRFRPAVFVDDDIPAPLTSVGNPAAIPSAPVIAVALAAGAATGSLFVAGDNGQYRYRIAGINAFGRSASVAVSGSPVTVAVGDGVTFSVSSGGIPADYYEVYRSLVNGLAGTERLIARVANSGSPMIITDLNQRIPGTTKAFGFQLNKQAMSFKQLAPMMKIPFARIDLSDRWAQVIFGTPRLYAPGKVMMFTNVGRLPASVS